MIGRLLQILFRRPPAPREVVFVSFAEADRLLERQEGWRLAPEEDDNDEPDMVYLERDAR